MHKHNVSVFLNILFFAIEKRSISLEKFQVVLLDTCPKVASFILFKLNIVFGHERVNPLGTVCTVCCSAPLLRWTLVGTTPTAHAHSLYLFPDIIIITGWAAHPRGSASSIFCFFFLPPLPLLLLRSENYSTEGVEAIRWRNDTWTRAGYGKWKSWK